MAATPTVNELSLAQRAGVTVGDMVADPDIAVVLAAYEASARGDIDAAVARLHPAVEWIEPDEFPNGGRHVGPEAVATYLRASSESWAELKSPPRAGVERDDTVADGFTLENGLVTHMQAYADPGEAISA
jgi:ketosteroid isomerase-like protein